MGIIKITDDNYSTEVEENDGVVLLDFYADWCGPCKMMSPIIEGIAGEEHEKLTVGKINVDDNPELSKKFGIMSIPTIVSVKDGKEVARFIGIKGKNVIMQMLNGLGIE